MSHDLLEQAPVTVGTPDPGALVSVRERRWVVESVKASGLPAQAVGPDPRKPMHLVSLVSVEDDALGEELQVVWEIEPGARLHENMALPEPERFDEPARLEGFLDAVRWGAVVNADREHLQAPFRSGIELEDYQLEPVIRCLEMPRVNLLLADDVGLGKTIESGLVIQELILRNRIRTVLILCPASLCLQWQDQMREKFGLEFRIVDLELMRELRRKRGIHTNPWTHFPRLIASIDFFKRDRPFRRFCEALPPQATYPRRFDMLLVDEAHNVAPSGTGQYAIDSQRTEAIRRIVPHFEHKLFLTATPHNGYQESFTALLELLDDQRFARGIEPDEKQKQSVMVRRLKSDLKDWDGSPRFAQRRLIPLEVEYNSTDRDAHRALTEYSELRRKRAKSATETVALDFVLKLLKKRLFSSPAAFESTLAKHRQTLLSTKKAKKRKPPSIKVLRSRIAGLEDDYGNDTLLEESTDELLETTADCLESTTEAELAILDDLAKWASKSSQGADTKARMLLDWLETELRPGGKWNNQRVIIFTEYRDTQKWLHGLLAQRGLAKNGRLALLHGALLPDDREIVKAAFQAHPDVSEVRILLATDAASEGIDLQNHCHLMVHYEIPWNPNRLEQRNGRIDRHGQKQPEVLIHHFVGAGYGSQPAGTRAGELEGDLEFLMRAAEKVQAIRQDLGKVGPVIAQQVEEAMLGRRRTMDTTGAEERGRAAARQLRVERELSRLEETRNRLKESRQSMRVEPSHVLAVVKLGLEIGEQPPLRPADEEGTYWLPTFRGSWGMCAQGLLHPHTQEVRRVTFEHDRIKGRDDLVLIHLNHPLVSRCLRLLRGEIWKSSGEKRIFRVTARRVPDRYLEEPLLLAHARLVVLGGRSHRLHEEMVVAGGRVRDGRFARVGPEELQKALEHATDRLPDETNLERFQRLWPEVREGLRGALVAREKDRTRTLQSRLDRKREREIGDLTSVLQELESRIRKELKEAKEPQQLDLFKPDEEEQWKKDRHLLEIRLSKIPEELQQETAAMARRYENPSARLFPVAVEWLIPERLCR